MKKDRGRITVNYQEKKFLKKSSRRWVTSCLPFHKDRKIY
jgi:hypothetical protein